MHECCKGQNNCNIDRTKEIKINTKEHNNIPIIICYHQKIICQLQKTWYGPTKYCSCSYHEKLIDIKR